ncbi:MAG: mycofactocin system FadH/OYE family oxidoreductase 1 [Acidimicrobiales bacterium]
MTELGDRFELGSATSPNRIVFGPHETNLGLRRSISERHVAYYSARARGGAGIVVIEEASVHASDWPYERSPLASACGEGWREVALACHADGALAIAAVGHSGGQGSSAYHQRALWGPSRTPDVATREAPVAMEMTEIAELVSGYAEAGALACAAGCDGVEINAGQWSLLRQFASGLTNQRSDDYGTDRARFLREVLLAVRAAAPRAVIGLRASCDELAPWAGLVPEAAASMLAALAGEPGAGERCAFDYVTVVRGSAYGASATRADGHERTGFNRELAALIRKSLPPQVAVIAQGSIVDADMARAIVGSGEADAVEMTRAQIADPNLTRKLLAGVDARIRPCVLCNQLCQVRDARNPIVSCIGEPRTGHETHDPDPETTPAGTHEQSLLVVGGGPAGLECARVAALAGLRVTVIERRLELGGMVTFAAARAPGRQRLSMLTSWLESECRLAGVELVTGHEVTLEELDAHEGPVAICTGSRPGRRAYDVMAPGTAVTAADVLGAERLPGDPGPGPVVVWDPIGGPVGVGVAELLAGIGGPVLLVTPDFVAGEQLARTGDLAPANVRLARAGVEIVKHSIVRAVDMNGVTVEDRFSADRRLVPDALLVDAGHRLPEDALYRSLGADTLPRGPVMIAGDAVAPRTIHEAILEGRRVGLSLAQAAVALPAASR